MARLGRALGAFFFAALACFAVWWLGPGILDDFRHRNEHLQPALDYRIVETSCRTRLLVFDFCGLKILGPAGERRILSYLVFDRFGDEPFELLRPSGAIEGGPYLTTRLGIDRLVNRFASLVVIFAVLISLSGAGLSAAIRRIPSR